jgi:two-component system KDP operon response regulator KdpE
MSDGKVTVLLIEDDPGIIRFLRNTLRIQEYEVKEATRAGEGTRLALQQKPDLVVLDLGLPDRDGLDVIRDIRAFSAVPILVLSSRSDEAAKVTALDLGADDYVSKPFGVGELMARLRTALRHRLACEGSLPTIHTGGLSMDLMRRIVTVDEEPVKLSRKEYDILRELAVHAGRVLTHRHLMRVAWGSDSTDVQYLRVYVRQLRLKIEQTPENPRYILTEPGVGYRLAMLD